MIHKLFLGITALVCCGLMACSSQEDEPVLLPTDPDNPSVTNIEAVTVKAADILSGNAATRTAFELQSDKLAFSWAEGDRIGIFPCTTEGNSQVALDIHSGAGSKNATFTGGGWALRTDIAYVAYYPYDLNGTNSEILFSYEGQCQTGNASLAHLGKHDLMATVATSAVDGALNFDFAHLNSFAQLNLTLPVNAAFTALTLQCNDAIFWKTGKLNLSSETAYDYAISGEAVNRLRMELKDVNTTADVKTLTLYMNLPPIDMSGHQVFVILHSSDNKVYQAPLVSKTMVQGKAYRFDATLVDVTVNSTIDSPPFKDEVI